MKLLQLPNGNFVRPDTVTSITALPTEQNINLHRARVIIRHGNGSYCEILTANDDDHARTMAVEMAELINNAIP